MTLRGEQPDVVASYLGLRDVKVGSTHLLLNHDPFYLRSVLEQGYWPTSHLVAPSLDAYRAEVQLMIDLGFTSARIHQKVEDERSVFWADKLGLTLWCETAGAYEFDAEAVSRLTKEWVDIVRTYESHPSIICWVPFNESWGITHANWSDARAAYSRALTDLTRALDPTRPVVSNDGWEHANSDLLTIHDYEWREEVLAARYTPEGLETMLDGVGPAGRVLTVGDQQPLDVPVLLTEFGGVRFVPAAREGQTWGYSAATSPEDYEERLGAIMRPVKAAPILGGFCYTQITDTMQEANGLCDENRVPKLPVETLRRLIAE